MKKFGMMMVLLMASMGAYAASSPKNAEENKNVITPDFATGMWRTSYYEYDAELNILVCPRGMTFAYGNPYNTCTNLQGKSVWVKMENIVPKGKKFVGFKSVSQGSSNVIEIYWK